MLGRTVPGPVCNFIATAAFHVTPLNKVLYVGRRAPKNSCDIEMNEYLKVSSSKEKVKPVSRGARNGAWFIFVIGTIAIVLAFVFGVFIERSSDLLLMLVPISASLYVFGSIAITGYAPKFLLFTHAEKNESDT